MSNRHNYTNYSKQNNQKEEEQIGGKVQIDDTVTNPEPQTNQPEPQTNQPEPQTVTNPEPQTEPETVTGVVVNCKKLNIREEPNKVSEVLCVINTGEEVEIIEEFSTDDFYAVIYGKNKEVSIEGYCMKNYIELNK